MKRERYFEATEFENIKEIVYDAVKKYGDRDAFILKHKKGKEVNYENISYKRFWEEVNSLGTKLFQKGLKNKRIAIVGRNRYEWVLSYLACLLGGIEVVPLDKELQVEELESCLIRSKADVLIFDEKYQPIIEEIKNRNRAKLEECICMSKVEDYNNIYEYMEEGKQEIQQGNKEYINVEIDSYKMNILLFTSGTTSQSKAVMLSQNNIASNIYAMQLVEKFEVGDVNLAILPFHHIFDSTGLLVMIACGVITTFPDGLRYLSQNLKEYKVSVFIGVPLLVEKIYQKIEQGIEKKGKTNAVKIGKIISKILLFFHIDIRNKIFKDIINELGGHMRFVISGGAPLDKKIAKGFNELGIKMVQGYGLSETSPVIAAENHKKIKYGSIGIPMDNVEVAFEDVDKDGIGELKVKGPNVMLGYYENPEKTKEVLRDGWFYTGDLGYMDKQGFLFITGRKKDMIVLKNGKKVFPEEIETIINRLDEVAESMVYGIPEKDDRNNVKLSVKIVYDKEYINENYKDKTQEELKEIIWNKIKEINKTFPPYKYIKNMILTDEELIKTTTHKIKRREEMKKILA